MSDELFPPHAVRKARRWVQIGVTPAAALSAGDRACLYEEISDLTSGLTEASRIENHFFMHKPPGLRLRFQARPHRRSEVVTAVGLAADRWAASGLVSGWTHGCYEPETALFGGEVSMRFVHRLFSADSSVWLHHHAAGRAPAWLVALLLTKSLLDAFRITPWEDSDVGHLIQRTGRTLAGTTAASGEVVTRVSELWRDPRELLRELNETETEVVTSFRASARAEVPRWQAEYLDTPLVTVGPRRLIACYAVFMWNRARLSPFRQGLLADSLARIT